MKIGPLMGNENGTALLITMIILTIGTMIGIAALNTSYVENQIAGNDKWQKVAFHAADGGTEAGRELLEENFSCPNGFTQTSIGGLQIWPDIANDYMASYVSPPYDHRQFMINETEPPTPYPTDTKRDIRIGPNDTVPHTNLVFFGNTGLSSGNALQMIAGYEGKGFGAAGGGAFIVTEIHSQHMGMGNSRAVVAIHWRHLIGHEGTCRY